MLLLEIQSANANDGHNEMFEGLPSYVKTCGYMRKMWRQVQTLRKRSMRKSPSLLPCRLQKKKWLLSNS